MSRERRACWSGCGRACEMSEYEQSLARECLRQRSRSERARKALQASARLVASWECRCRCRSRRLGLREAALEVQGVVGLRAARGACLSVFAEQRCGRFPGKQSGRLNRRATSSPNRPLLAVVAAVSSAASRAPCIPFGSCAVVLRA